MKLSAQEQAIYAAAYVAEFNRLHAEGVHPQFRIDYADVSQRIRMWEEWCSDCALDSANSAVSMWRKAKTRAGQR